jgi:hypothetical protein
MSASRVAATSKKAAAAAAAAALDGLEDGPRRLMRLAVNQAAEARGLTAPWDPGLPAGREAQAAEAIRMLAPAGPAVWGAAELGSLYETVLAAEVRKQQGIWFTPEPVAESVTRMAIPASRCGCRNPACGLQVMALDPACGAGVFLIAAARRVAAVYAALMSGQDDPPEAAIRFALPVVMESCVFGADTDPVAVELARSACWLEIGGTRPITWLDDNIVAGDTLAGALPKPLADRLDGPQPLIVVGNPPYRDKARGAAPWIEARRRDGELIPRPSLDEFRCPGNTQYVLSSLYVYFWRWALWQVFEARQAPGAAAFITPSAYLVSDAFGNMRAHMRRCADQGWIVNLSPEGHQPKVSSRIFPGVQQRLCIGVMARGAAPDPQTSAHIRYAEVSGGRDQKIARLQALASTVSPSFPALPEDQA